MKYFKFYSLILFFTLICCKEKKVNQTHESIEIYNLNNKEELTQLNDSNLDETHPNLLNPQISKNDFDEVMTSWTDLHQRIGNYLSKNDFQWQIKEPSISIFHKFYFEPNGKIKSYFFRILSKDVTDSKVEEYANMISEFAKTQQIDFKKDNQFAQCGKTQYISQ